MRAEDTLQYMADFYPDIFPTRKHCLNQLFCVIGNGFEWINGELIDNDDEYSKRYKLRKFVQKAKFKNEQTWLDHREYYINLYDGDNSKIPWRYHFSWYPLHKDFSKLYNYPEDIKDDWKELLEECKQMLIADGVKL